MNIALLLNPEQAAVTSKSPTIALSARPPHEAQPQDDAVRVGCSATTQHVQRPPMMPCGPQPDAPKNRQAQRRPEHHAAALSGNATHVQRRHLLRAGFSNNHIALIEQAGMSRVAQARTQWVITQHEHLLALGFSPAEVVALAMQCTQAMRAYLPLQAQSLMALGLTASKVTERATKPHALMFFKLVIPMAATLLKRCRSPDDLLEMGNGLPQIAQLRDQATSTGQQVPKYTSGAMTEPETFF